MKKLVQEAFTIIKAKHITKTECLLTGSLICQHCMEEKLQILMGWHLPSKAKRIIKGAQ